MKKLTIVFLALSFLFTSLVFCQEKETETQEIPEPHSWDTAAIVGIYEKIIQHRTVLQHHAVDIKISIDDIAGDKIIIYDEMKQLRKKTKAFFEAYNNARKDGVFLSQEHIFGNIELVRLIALALDAHMLVKDYFNVSAHILTLYDKDNLFQGFVSQITGQPVEIKVKKLWGFRTLLGLIIGAGAGLIIAIILGFILLRPGVKIGTRTIFKIMDDALIVGVFIGLVIFLFVL